LVASVDSGSLYVRASKIFTPRVPMEAGAFVWFRVQSGPLTGTWVSSTVESKDVASDGKLSIVVVTETLGERHTFV